ncbi:MAG: hypothetical protein KDA47_17015 [Planctomycetales bacterium]|nr:hypothetical protein [Planctomycetales bacterium]
MQEGGDEAYWTLYVRYVLQNESLQRLIRERLPSDRIAEPVDIAGDAFQEVWRKAREGAHREFNNRGNLLALLTCYAKAKANDARKRLRPRGDSSVAGDGPADIGEMGGAKGQPSDDELRAAWEGIEDRLAMLGSDEQRNVALAALEGRTHEEIAALLGLGNVKRVERALEAIRHCWTSEHVFAFERRWEDGETPAFERSFLEFPEGGKWLFRDLLCVELHQRLRRHLPISKAEIKCRLGNEEFATIVDRIFQTELFFDETPSARTLDALRSELNESVVNVMDLKLAGKTNEKIASQLKWPLSSVKDAIAHIRRSISSAI